MGLFAKNASVWSLKSLPLRRFFDLQYASVEFCIRRGIHLMPELPLRTLDFGAGFAPYHELFPERFTLETLDAHLPANYRSWNDVPAKDYDLILAIEVLEHLEDPEEFLRQARAHLRPSGELWVSVPYSVRIHPCPDDWNRWTPQGLERLFLKHDFEVTEFSSRGPSPMNIVAKMAYANFRLLRDPLVFILGIALLPFTIVLLALTHLVLMKARPVDEDPLGFFIRARPR